MAVLPPILCVLLKLLVCVANVACVCCCVVCVANVACVCC